MKSIQKLIEELCPDGVEELPLNAFANFSNNGVDKKIIENEIEVRLLNFKDVFNLQLIKAESISAITTVSKDKLDQVLVKKNDFYITPSSEVKDEIGMSAVIAEEIPNTVYSYHIARIRINDFERINPYFISYLFSSSRIRNQISQISQGNTRYGLTKPMWESLVFPVPPLEIQKEIVKILDNFTLLEAELELMIKAELDDRKKQYIYYRNTLLNDASKPRRKYRLEEICTLITSGGTPSTSKQEEYYGGEIPWVRTTDVSDIGIYDTPKKITADGLKNSSAKMIPSKSVIIAMIGATVGKVAFTEIPVSTNQNCCNLVFNSTIANYKYIFYWLLNNTQLLIDLAPGAVPILNASVIRNISVELPDINEQIKVANILDRFSRLIADIERDFPSECISRRKQYEYYREELLSFKELESA